MRKTIFFSVLGFVALLCVSLVFFRVGTIECQVVDDSCTDEMQSQLDSLKGKSLFLTNFEEAIPQSISDETTLYVSHQKLLPTTLVVSLQKEDPAYLLTSNDTVLTVFASGVAQQMPAIDKSTHHSIEVSFPLETIISEGKVDTEKHQILSEFAFSLYKTQFDLQNSKWIDSQTIQLDLPSGIRVLLPFEEAPQKVEALEAIVASTEIETITEPITEIDLRYKYPVLRTTE